MPFRFDRNKTRRRLIVYFWDDNLSEQITYRPPSQPAEYFFKHVGHALGAYGQTR